MTDFLPTPEEYNLSMRENDSNHRDRIIQTVLIGSAAITGGFNIHLLQAIEDNSFEAGVPLLQRCIRSGASVLGLLADLYIAREVILSGDKDG